MSHDNHQLIIHRLYLTLLSMLSSESVSVYEQEGKQASLAADFSITQFKHIGRLLMVHGRNSYKRSAALGQFVMHRGMIISTMQVQKKLSGTSTTVSTS